MDAGADVSKESQDVGLDWVSCDLVVGHFAYLRRQRGPEQGWSGVQRMWRAECKDGAQEQHRRTALRLAEWTGRAVVRTAVDRGLALPAGLAWCGWGGSWRLAWSPHCGAHCHMWHKAGAAACAQTELSRPASPLLNWPHTPGFSSRCFFTLFYFHSRTTLG